ncbi:YhgE/Pip domain-containing protein [Ornithinibacillus massiliensis]|uniref:YhgE/Pip domain-containing protein n=2 Tax=Ornithinibacillus massiliensis TaxID=1944633 RepID=A0ABS5MEW1_9BACI|nr:YhgE/Pip domain-containing protein [Ornithinibacillus massiliensis]MBS3680866.1 YhgE/Pip domain-containing protein [Ornithinibacillus massiliensis]
MMRRLKKILLVFATVILLLPSFLVTANATNDSNKQESTAQEKGEITAKDEVIYATLDTAGKSNEIYVVNTLDIAKAGMITDYGTYTSLRNLSDIQELNKQGDAVTFSASEGKFYYQGNINDAALPWDITISYFLDGKEISPEDLAGEDGHVTIRIETAINESMNPVFMENYLLQISVPLNTEIFTNIKADDGMIANAGKDKQVTFTVMPENEAELEVEADVVDFEIDGISFTGIPSSMSIDGIDVDGMTGDIQSLSDAIEAINDGVRELHNGVSELNAGTSQLVDGSKQYQDGVKELANSSTDLVNGSKELEEALTTLNSSLSSTEEMDMSGLEGLIGGLYQLSDGLGEIGNGLNELKTNYRDAYDALDKAINEIPAYQITNAEISALRESGADQEVINRLLATYEAAQKVKGTYSAVKPGFDAVGETLTGVNKSLSEMANQVDKMANGLSDSLEEDGMDGFSELQEGIAMLSANYKAFHSGLVEYTGGVSQIASAYNEVHSGMVELSEGTNELENGVGELHDGTNELSDSTSNLPEQMTEEIDEMMSDYDKSDFEPVSFVSSKNEKVNSVQFVFKTESIQQEEPEENNEPVEEKKGFWELFLDLFR